MGEGVGEDRGEARGRRTQGDGVWCSNKQG